MAFSISFDSAPTTRHLDLFLAEMLVVREILERGEVALSKNIPIGDYASINERQVYQRHLSLNSERYRERRMKKVYDPVAKCIYCGSTEPPLTNEHIVPYALNGEHVLPHSSCENCQKEIGRFEIICLRTMFQQMRAVGKMNSRKKKHRPRSFKLKYSDHTGEHIVDIATEKYPTVVALPVYREAGMLTNQRTAREFSVWTFFDKRKLIEFAQEHGLNRFKPALAKIHPMAFARLLAKIAHGYAVGQLGDGGFKPFLTPIILGISDQPENFVGTAPKRVFSGSKDFAYRLKMDVLSGGQIVISIQLFPNIDAPTYQVVAGQVVNE